MCSQRHFLVVHSYVLADCRLRLFSQHQSHYHETVPTHGEPLISNHSPPRSAHKDLAEVVPSVKTLVVVAVRYLEEGWERAEVCSNKSALIFILVGGTVFDLLRSRVLFQFSELRPSCPPSTRHYQTTTA